MKTVLLTGASGFLGRYLLETLKQQYEVCTLGRKPVEGFQHIRADLGAEGGFRLNRYDKVVHAAGQAHFYPKTTAEKDSFYQVNLEGTRRLLKALKANPPAELVFISTVAVYGLVQGENTAETAPLAATDPYGRSKIEAEGLLEEAAGKMGFSLMVLRLPLVVGSNAPGNLGRMAKAIQNGNYIRIGNALARKSMVLATDVAELVANARGAGGTYNLTDGYHPSFLELEQAIANHYGKGSKIRQFPQWALRVAALAGDAGEVVLRSQLPFNSLLYQKITSSLTFSDQLARQHLGWQPQPVLQALPKIL